MIYPWIGRDAIETERLREKNIEACASAEKLYKEWIYKAVDRARFLPLLEPMCSKLEREWNELIQETGVEESFSWSADTRSLIFHTTLVSPKKTPLIGT